MKKVLFTLIILIVILANCANNNNTKYDTARIQNVYTEYCSSCHGNKVEEFRNIKWKYGTTKKEIIASIADGNNNFGMPSFKGTLTKRQISKLASLMLDGLENKYSDIKNNKLTTNVFKYKDITVRLDTIATDLENPWGFAQLPTGDYLITDKIGILYKVDAFKKKVEIKGIPKANTEGQGGLLDIALHPNYNQNGWIYISYSKEKEIDGETLRTTAIVRGKLNNTKFEEQQEIFEAKPYTSTRHHYGSRLTFDEAGHLYFSVGERGKHFEYPQSLENDNGKIHCINDDGSIPNTNPFIEIANAKKSIYSYGHRNPQGLVYDKATKQLWENEHGPRGGDEVNLIKKGANYGWPVISYGTNYDGSILTKLREKDGMEQPNWYWVPSISTCGIAVVNSTLYPAWKGSLLIGSLKFNYVNRCIVENNVIVGEEKLFENIGRLRNVTMGSDGHIYIATENPGMVYKVVSITNN